MKISNIFFIFTIIFLLVNPGSFALAEENLDSVTLEVRKGDSLSEILETVGVGRNESRKIIEELSNVYDVNKIRVGQRIKVNFAVTPSEEVQFSSLEIKISKTEKIEVTRLDSDIFFSHIVESYAVPKIILAIATIDESFFDAAKNSGISLDMMKELSDAYSYDVDLQRDIKKGDQLKVLYEGMYNEEGKLVGNGDILYASLRTGRGTFAMYHYTTIKGDSDYYDESGNNVEKSLLMTPIDGARITSNYGGRKHPLLGYTKMHKGIDFGAPKGTPVYAAGDGVIVEMRRKGAYGKYVQIFHNSEYTTAYAHLNGFAKNLRRSSKVRQGQIIGYVGSTGRSTGPHLHYEVLVKGRHVDPLSIKSVSGSSLKGEEKDLFMSYMNQVAETIDRLSKKEPVRKE